MPIKIQKIKAYEQVLKSQEKVISHYREQEKKWQEAVNTLESEREMNQRLTEELEFWKLRCEEFYPTLKPVYNREKWLSRSRVI